MGARMEQEGWSKGGERGGARWKEVDFRWKDALAWSLYMHDVSESELGQYRARKLLNYFVTIASLRVSFL